MLCAKCKGRGWCGKPCIILSRIKHWKATIENIKKDLYVNTPPACFVGRHSYPNVYYGILAPYEHKDNAELYDYPELWFNQKLSIEEILNYRAQMVYSRRRDNVKRQSKYLEITQEIVCSKKSVDLEIYLKNRPRLSFSFNAYTLPIGNPARVKDLRLASNPKIEKTVDKVVSDYDLKANDAIFMLYEDGLEISKIQRILSLGLLGVKSQRKMVPTRWAWTAVHSTIGNELLREVKSFEKISSYLVFNAEYLGNHFEVLLLPDVYQYELIEVKYPGSVWNLLGSKPLIFKNYESHFGLKKYAEETAGAFYAARLACLEYLRKIRRQASVLVVREVYSSYYAPLGVWIVENTVREAFKNKETFENLEEALNAMAYRLKAGDRFVRQSKLLKIFRTQHKLDAFSNKILEN